MKFLVAVLLTAVVIGAAHAQTPATGAFLSYNSYAGAAPLPLYFNINGTNYQFPFTTGGVVGPAATTLGHCATWANTKGTLLGDTLCSTGLSALTQDVTASGTGSVPATVVGLQGRPVASTAPTIGQSLVWNGSQWAPGGGGSSGYVLVGGDTTSCTLAGGDTTTCVGD